MLELNSLNDGYFSIEHLAKETDLSLFECKKGKGLEHYLKNMALQDEINNVSRTYIIRSVDNDEIVAYFSLRTGLITVSRGLFKGFDAITGIELANFAVNDLYRESNDVIPQLGSYIFKTFVLPLVKEISVYVGAAYIYIFSLPKYKLLEHYITMGFRRTTVKMERFVYRHVKPAYDKDCVFMFQLIN